MIEFDVDMGYLLEAGDLDCVILNDENGEYEPMKFTSELGSGTCCDVSVDSSTQFYCSECECTVEVPLLWGEINFCPNCGAKVVS